MQWIFGANMDAAIDGGSIHVILSIVHWHRIYNIHSFGWPFISRKLFIVASRDYALLFVDPVLFCFCFGRESVQERMASHGTEIHTHPLAHTQSIAICLSTIALFGAT